MITLWDKGISAAEAVEDFTVGDDRVLDMKIAKHDVIASKAHAAMLAKIGLLTSEEEQILQSGLDEIAESIKNGSFVLEDEAEDIHSQVEILLTRKYGDVGKKLHSGRSRNDQVLVDIKLFLREEVLTFKDEILDLFNKLQALSNKYENVLMPGYTHAQVAMPSSFGLWFGAYAETLADDMVMVNAAYRIVNQNPLGSAAGYGNSFPLDRDHTTTLLGFDSLNYNSIAAQMSRGKSEKSVASAIAAVASTLNKFASDCCQYMCTNFKFISFPDSLTTGSSIMPHKKNPDVWEVMRAKTDRLQSIQNEIALLCTNMPHGYHRDLQLLKDILFPALDTLHKCLKMTMFMLDNISVNEHLMENPLFDPMFTVETVNEMVLSGVPFRDAYKKIGIMVREGKYAYDKPKSVESLHHSHKGSIGNLCNEEIKEKMMKAVREMNRTIRPEE